MNNNIIQHTKIERKRLYNALKTIFDFSAALILLIIFLPLFVIISLVIKCSSKGPVIYKQQRVGKNNKLFNVYKFRTMYVGTPIVAAEKINGSSEYVTKVGKILRKTSLDEIPQLINIIKGDMSFIGYRPLIPQEKEIHELRNKLGVYKIKPGITGWAQVNGRNNVSIYNKAYFDYYYLINRSILLDIKIFILTVIKVVKQDGINKEVYTDVLPVNGKYTVFLDQLIREIQSIILTLENNIIIDEPSVLNIKLNGKIINLISFQYKKKDNQEITGNYWVEITTNNQNQIKKVKTNIPFSHKKSTKLGYMLLNLNEDSMLKAKEITLIS